MSRIGNRKLVIPEGVTVTEENRVITVKGPRGELTTKLVDGITVKVEGNTLEVLRDNDNRKAMHGTTNANINNMIEGVTNGFTKELEIVGVGYRVMQKGAGLVITAGFSHPVDVVVPKGITVEVPSNTQLIIKGIDKILVGEFAASVRKIREPEPYKGKGIRYKDEHVRHKERKKTA